MVTVVDTFVQVEPDCPVERSVVPANRNESKPSAHVIQYELLSRHPYRYTLDDLIYEVHIRRSGIPLEEAAANESAIKAELFRKSHPCMRASMLPKKYGWGVHHDPQGRIALYGMETPEYRSFVKNTAGGPKLVFAMRSKRA
jgi:hypothetical protein